MSNERGASAWVVAAYVTLSGLLVVGFAYLGTESRRQHKVWTGIRLLQTVKTEAEADDVGAELIPRDPLLFLVKELGRPTEDNRSMRVCSGFARVFTGEHEPMSRAQRGALARLGRQWARGSDIERSAAEKLDRFLDGESVQFTAEERARMEEECAGRRDAYVIWQRRLARVVKQVIDEKFPQGQGLSDSMIGEISLLLSHDDDQTRYTIGDVMIGLGARSVKWLKKWIERDPINPVFRVATAEMTEEEKGMQLLRQDTAAKREAMRVLEAIGTPAAMVVIQDARAKPTLSWLFTGGSPKGAE